MALSITSLNSGSNGNCYYVGNGEEAVLVDVGISCREIEKRMINLHLNIDQVKAIFISHEHVDHIRGVEVLAKKYQISVYITSETLRKSRLSLNKNLIRSFEMNSAVMIGNLNITPFEKNHDAADPCSFIVEGNGVKVGVFTDIGKICKPLIHHFKQCHAVFLESNYDEQMLAEGSYPMHLKKRIAGGKGHLSNNQALELFITHRATYLSHLILSHLSKENNHPEKVQQLFNFHAQRTKIIVASRHHETEVYRIAALPTQVPKTQPLTMPLPVVQMSLFS